MKIKRVRCVAGSFSDFELPDGTRLLLDVVDDKVRLRQLGRLARPGATIWVHSSTLAIRARADLAKAAIDIVLERLEGAATISDAKALLSRLVPSELDARIEERARASAGSPLGYLVSVHPGSFLFGPRGVEVRDRGLVVTWRRRTRSIEWNEILRIRQSVIQHRMLFVVPAGTNYDLRLHLEQGDTIRLTQTLAGMDQLARTIEEKTLNYRLQRALARLSEGKELDFGKFTLSASELRCEEKVLPWSQVAFVALDGGQVMVGSIRSKFWPWANVRVFDVPDVLVFLLISSRFTLVKGVNLDM